MHTIFTATDTVAFAQYRVERDRGREQSDEEDVRRVVLVRVVAGEPRPRRARSTTVARSGAEAGRAPAMAESVRVPSERRRACKPVGDTGTRRAATAGCGSVVVREGAGANDDVRVRAADARVRTRGRRRRAAPPLPPIALSACASFARDATACAPRDGGEGERGHRRWVGGWCGARENETGARDAIGSDGSGTRNRARTYAGSPVSWSRTCELEMTWDVRIYLASEQRRVTVVGRSRGAARLARRRDDGGGWRVEATRNSRLRGGSHRRVVRPVSRDRRATRWGRAARGRTVRAGPARRGTSRAPRVGMQCSVTSM